MWWRSACVLVLSSLGALAACRGESTGAERVSVVEGTCACEGHECKYPSSYDRSNPGSDGRSWCYSSRTGDPCVLHERTDGTQVTTSNVRCAELGFPVRCSNCTGRDFYYPEGHVCNVCAGSSGTSGSGTGTSSGSSGKPPCNFSECLQTCYEAGGTNCGTVCKCD